VALEEVWAVRAEAEEAGWEVRSRQVLVGSASALPADTANLMSGVCRVQRGSARNVLRR
jgi:hypothetical protein